jgi:hypothetical protein
MDQTQEKVLKLGLVRKVDEQVDRDGDLARKRFIDAPAERDDATARPLPAFAHNGALQSIAFHELRPRCFESVALPPEQAFGLFREAAETLRGSALTPVLLAFRLRDGHLDGLARRVQEAGEGASTFAAEAFFARRQKDFRKRSGFLEWRGRQKERKQVGVASMSSEEARAPSFFFERGKRFTVMALLPCENWQLPAALAYGGWNDAPEPLDQSVALREWNNQFGTELVYVGPDYLEMWVPAPVADVKALCALTWEHFLFAPDIVDQGGDPSLGALAHQLGTRSTWFFWWD